jgi:tRNA nucleotidyltransferase (CCA-adding enzyme)
MSRSARPPEVRIYRVGGSVRDELIGRADADRDWVVVGATPEWLIASGFRPVGRDFPVFLHPETHEEYALARTERKHGRGYRGFEFFASPEVTLEDDLRRRDLTINAMARAENGTLIDPYGGADDLRAGILRHVSPAFAEDPLRVLRVARFAARFGFAVAPETMALMRAIAAGGELALLSPERVWQELARGLMEPTPSRLLAVLRDCGALEQLLPEVDVIYGRAKSARGTSAAGKCLAVALDYAAAKGCALPVRYAVLAQDLAPDPPAAGGAAAAARHATRCERIAEAMSARLKVPLDCRDAARLAARWHRSVDRAAMLTAAALLDLLNAADALRRPERLDALIGAAECKALSRPRAGNDYPAGALLRDALAVARKVDAAAIARGAGDARAKRKPLGDGIAAAIRAARIKALRAWIASREAGKPRYQRR